MSGLTEAQIDGELLTETEIVANTIILFLAGQYTTRSLISNSLVELFRHPDQLQLLRNTPELDRPAVEEFLRAVGTIQMIPQRALADVTVGDTHLAEGDEMFLVLASANRDAAVYDDPERLVVTRFAGRRTSPTTAFGFGSHLPRREPCTHGSSSHRSRAHPQVPGPGDAGASAHLPRLLQPWSGSPSSQ